MASQNSQKKEPLKLKVILPLVALILLLSALFAMIQVSKSPYTPMSTLELSESFSTYVAKFKERDHYKLFIGHKKVTLSPGAALDELLQEVEDRELISSIDFAYKIPIFSNLVGDWIFALKDNDFQAQVPLPSFGEATFDPATLQVNFKSELAEEKKAVFRTALKEKLVGYQFAMDPATQASLETESRQQVQIFLETWLKATYKNLPSFKYQITFTGSKNSGSPEEP